MSPRRIGKGNPPVVAKKKIPAARGGRVHWYGAGAGRALTKHTYPSVILTNVQAPLRCRLGSGPSCTILLVASLVSGLGQNEPHHP